MKSKYYNQRVEVEILKILKLGCSNELVEGEIIDPDPKTPEQIAEEKLHDLRLARTTKLRKSDWTQFPDVPESTRLVWQTYRQELRDITNTYTSLEDVVWPEKPD